MVAVRRLLEGYHTPAAPGGPRIVDRSPAQPDGLSGRLSRPVAGVVFAPWSVPDAGCDSLPSIASDCNGMKTADSPARFPLIRQARYNSARAGPT